MRLWLWEDIDHLKPLITTTIAKTLSSVDDKDIEYQGNPAGWALKQKKPLEGVAPGTSQFDSCSSRFSNDITTLLLWTPNSQHWSQLGMELSFDYCLRIWTDDLWTCVYLHRSHNWRLRKRIGKAHRNDHRTGFYTFFGADTLNRHLNQFLRFQWQECRGRCWPRL